LRDSDHGLAYELNEFVAEAYASLPNHIFSICNCSPVIDGEPFFLKNELEIVVDKCNLRQGFNGH